MSSDKTIKLIAKKLQSSNTEEVLFTINQIRNTGGPKVLPFLIDLLSTSRSGKIKSAIISLLGDLKNKNSVPEIISALKQDKYFFIRKDLLVTCWQSGLDYSEYIELFVDLFISEDFGVAFEAFTIIDNFVDKYEPDKINPIIDHLKSKVYDFKENEKEGLFVELVHMLEKLRH